MNNENKLEEWEIICPDCNGNTDREYYREVEFIECHVRGQIMRTPIEVKENNFCFRCMGTGKITWIDEVMGK